MKPIILIISVILISFISACGRSKPHSPTLTLQSTNTNIPSEAIPQVTQEIATRKIPSSQTCVLSEWGFPSPDGQWLAKSCDNDIPPIQEYVQVSNTHDSRQWQVEWDQSDSYSSYLSSRYWSKDGAYLYLVSMNTIGGPMINFWDGSGLLRLNLDTGKSEEILPEGYYAFSFSTDNRLAYIHRGYQPPQFLNIMNLTRETLQSFSLGTIYCGIGHMMWSPQNDHIIFTAATCAEYPYIASLYSLVILDLVTGDYHTFYSSPNILPHPLKWEHDYPMYQTPIYNENTQPECWVLNLDVGGLLPAACP